MAIAFMVLPVFYSCRQAPDDGLNDTARHLQSVVDSLSHVLKGLQNTAIHSQIEGLQEKYEVLKQSVLFVVGASGNAYSQGTAFVIGENGLAISNHHVFSGMEKFVLIDSEGQRYGLGEILYQDSILDFIIFRIPGSNHKPLAIAKEMPLTGDHCFTIGNPQGLSFTLSTGIISALRPDRHQIQISAEIAPGSSGGPLFNAMGEVIGITTSTIGEANLNFALSLVKLGEGDDVHTPPEWAIAHIGSGEPAGNEFVSYHAQVESYYRAILENDWDYLKTIYAPVLDSYKTDKDVSREDVINRHTRFFNSFSAEFYHFNYEAYTQQPANDNQIITTAELEYELKSSSGIPLVIKITSIITFDENGKIVSVQEKLL